MAIQRGEVYFVTLDLTIGHEQAGRRPVVVVSNDILNVQPLVLVVVPGTKRARSPIRYHSNVVVPAGAACLVQETVFQTFQTRALDRSRVKEARRGVLGQAYLARIEGALAWTLDL